MDTKSAFPINPGTIMEKAALSDGFIELLPKRQPLTSNQPLSKELRLEADQYLDCFYNRLFSFLNSDAVVELDCYYSIHATVDHLANKLENQCTLEELQQAQQLLADILGDCGFLHSQTRDLYRDSKTDSFKHQVLNQAQHFNYTHLNPDSRISFALALGQQPPPSSPNLDDHSCCALNYTYHCAASAAQMHTDQLLQILRWQLLNLSANASEKSTLSALQSRFDEATRHTPFSTLKCYDKKYPSFADIRCIDDLLMAIANTYVAARRKLREELRKHRTNTSSWGQFNLYQQRLQINFAPFIHASDWDHYVSNLKSNLTDMGVIHPQKGTINIRQLAIDSETDAPPSSRAYRQLTQADIDQFISIVAKHYRNLRAIQKSDAYIPSESLSTKVSTILRATLSEDMFLVEKTLFHAYPAPLIAYALLVSPKNWRANEVDLFQRFKQTVTDEVASTEKGRKSQLAKILFFRRLVDFYSGLLQVPDSRVAEYWRADFIKMTHRPLTMALGKTSDNTYAFAITCFRENMYKRFSAPVIRGPVIDPNIDYAAALARAERLNPNLRISIRQSIQQHPKWVQAYRCLWSTPTYKYDYEKFLQDCIESEPLLQGISGKMVSIRHPRNTPKPQRLKPAQIVQCILEDELRRENIELTCQRVSELLLTAFQQQH